MANKKEGEGGSTIGKVFLIIFVIGIALIFLPVIMKFAQPMMTKQMLMMWLSPALIIIAIGICAVIFYVFWNMKKEQKTFQVFEDKNTLTMTQAKTILIKKFAEHGLPVTTITTGMWFWKKESSRTDAIDWLTQRYFIFRNKPVGQFEIAMKKGDFAGQILTLIVPLDKASVEGWNIQLLDENRHGYHFEKNNYPILGSASQVERTIEELYRLTGGDPEKIGEIRDIMGEAKELPMSATPPNDAVPDQFRQNWGSNRYPARTSYSNRPRYTAPYNPPPMEED